MGTHLSQVILAGERHYKSSVSPCFFNCSQVEVLSFSGPVLFGEESVTLVCYQSMSPTPNIVPLDILKARA